MMKVAPVRVFVKPTWIRPPPFFFPQELRTVLKGKMGLRIDTEALPQLQLFCLFFDAFP